MRTTLVQVPRTQLAQNGPARGLDSRKFGHFETLGDAKDPINLDCPKAFGFPWVHHIFVRSPSNSTRPVATRLDAL